MPSKEILRSEKLLERLAHHPDEKALKDERICKSIAILPEFLRAQNVFLYLSVQGEVDLTSLFELYTLKKNFAFPRVNGDELDFYYVKNLHHTEKGSFHILEPQRHLEKAFLKDADLIVVPGVVFSDNGHRVGYGKGFYDKVLAKTSCPKIGVAYQFQIVKNIEGQAHDVPMDVIVTEEMVLRF